MKKILLVIPLLFLPVMPAAAAASGETATAESSLEPRISKTFFQNAFVPASWRLQTTVSAPNPPNAALLPTRKITMQLPDSAQLRFQPSGPICPDNLVGPSPTNVSVPVPVIVKRCPNSVIGNGLARFLLAGNNQPELELDGQVVLFNGGLRQGLPLIKFYAFSYTTGVGIYTETVLETSGRMVVEFPVLSYDSAVNFLDIKIPSAARQDYLPASDSWVTVPGGKWPRFVQARCASGSFPFEADFLLGERLDNGEPIGPATELLGIGSASACQGATARALLAKPALRGPKTPRQKATYRVVIRNSDWLPLRGVTVRALGARGSLRVGSLAGRASRTVRLPVRFAKKGAVRLGVLVRSSNGGSKKVFLPVRVR